MTSRQKASAPLRLFIFSAEALKIAFADRAAASGNPDFINVPVERLTSNDYASERRRAIDPRRAQRWRAGVAQLEGAHTRHECDPVPR
ncbi:gamma-glutamyltransferase [Bradyrhizobium sp. URHD0069]|uniref:gamma-glutamyltransferase n=1 Tax=Bradyrhizobium sp. URHD0069 TaxID=1380355 RepID=UPI00049706E8